MCIEVDYHRPFYAVNLLEEISDGESYVSVDTEAAATVGTAVVESASDVNGPPSFYSQLGGLQ